MNPDPRTARPTALPGAASCSRLLLDPWRRRLLLAGGAAALPFPLVGCGGGTELLFAPYFPFSWAGLLDRQLVAVNFATTSVSADGASGSFDPGSCSISVANGTAMNFSGNFKNRNMSITVASPRAPVVARYNARFTDDDTVVFTPDGAGAAFTTVRNRDAFIPALRGDWVGTDAGGQPWRLSLATDPPDSDGDAAVLLTGTEQRGNAPAVPLLGSAVVRSLQLEIQRAGGSVSLQGTLAGSTDTPPRTQTINFAGGGRLQRA